MIVILTVVGLIPVIKSFLNNLIDSLSPMNLIEPPGAFPSKPLSRDLGRQKSAQISFCVKILSKY